MRLRISSKRGSSNDGACDHSFRRRFSPQILAAGPLSGCLHRRPRSDGGTVLEIGHVSRLAGSCGREPRWRADGCNSLLALSRRMGARLSGLHVTPPVGAAPVQAEPRRRGGRRDLLGVGLGCPRGRRRSSNEEATQRLTHAGSRRLATWSRASAIKLATPTWSSLASTSGKARRKPIHCRSPTRSSCDAVAQSWSCPPVVRRAARKLPSPGTGAAKPSGQSHDALPLLRLSRSVQIVTMIPLCRG